MGSNCLSTKVVQFCIIKGKRGGRMNYVLANGNTVIIRGIRVTDAQAVIEYMKEVNTETKNLTMNPDEFTTTLEQEQQYITRMLESENSFSYTVWYKGKLIGLCGIYGSKFRRLKHKVNLGISILQQYNNLGLGTQLMKLLGEKAKELGVTKMELEVRADNPNAIKVYERTGFVVEGLRKNGFYVDNKYVDLVQMGRLV